VGRIEQERCGLGIVTMAIRDLASPLEQGFIFFLSIKSAMMLVYEHLP